MIAERFTARIEARGPANLQSAWAGLVGEGGKEAGYGVEDQLFVGAPGRCDEEALWAVPGEAMDYSLSWQNLQALAYEVAVFI